MAQAVSPRNRQALELFAPLAGTYDRYARLLSLGQDPRWRRFLVSCVDVAPSDVVLDVATGTASVAIELARARRCSVVGIDQSADMLAVGRERVERAGAAAGVRLLEGRAEDLPFPDRCFDGLTFTYLLRYVDDPPATMRELTRVVRPGRTVASLEFGVPGGIWRPAWEAYVRAALPALGRAAGAGWAEVGRFLGDSIRDFYTRFPLDEQARFWMEAGIDEVRIRRLTFGGGVVIWGRRR